MACRMCSIVPTEESQARSPFDSITSTGMPHMLNPMTADSPRRGPAFRSAICALLILPATASAGVRFPSELVGAWDIGPENCRLPLNPDADSPIRIEGRHIYRYEDTDTASSIKRVSISPRAWQVVATSVAAPDVVTRDLFVVDGDSLTVTNSSSTVQYRRCLEAKP